MRALSVAYATLSMAFTRVTCPGCGRWLMSVPGRIRAEVRILRQGSDGSGRGRVVSCKRCPHQCEVIEHG